MAKIKAIAMDVDGTLTDGSIYIGKDGEAMKRFYVRDGQAIKHFLPRMGITPIVITGRKSEIVDTRCCELGIQYIIQDSHDKWNDLNAILSSLNIMPSEVAYIGDDINDQECMKQVGICACPADAVRTIKEISHFIASSKGGRGAVREFIEWLGERHEKNTNS